MDFYEILSILISNDDDHVKNFDDKLARILQKVMPLLPEDTRQFVKNFSNRDQYLQTVIYILRNIKQENAKVDTDAPLSVKQYRSIKIAVELIVSIGIIPCLLPNVGIDMAKLCPKALNILQEKELSCLKKYERLCFSTHSLLDLFEDLNLRPAVFSQLGPLMAALLQLSHAPLAKPTSEVQQSSNTNEQEFRMTVEEYQKLQNRQKEFHTKFISLLSNCPQYICFRELMIILGMQNAPKWLRRETQNYLIKMLVQSNGVLSLITAIFEDGLDLGADWTKLDTISKLIAVSYGKNADEYYKAVCPQILDLLSSDKIKHGSTIANCCIKVLYDYNPDACQKYIVEVICAPLMKKSDVTESERRVEQCIENLTKCFLPEDAKFKHLPCKVILHIATPLFCLYNKTRKSACVLKMNLRQLLSNMLADETTREKLYSVFLGHVTSTEFGDHVTSEFGPTGGIEITGANEDLEYEELADTVFDLMTTAKDLSPSLFRYMLQYLSNVNKQYLTWDVKHVLETEDDKMRRVTMQLAAYKLLSQLASTSTVQDAQVNNPEPLLSFIKSMLHEYTESVRTRSHQGEAEESECEVLYISLMLIKMILIEKRAAINIRLFKEFSTFLQNCRASMPTQVKSLIDEVVSCIITHDPSTESQDSSGKKYYEDLSTNPAVSSKFDEAMRDLSDPLLPVRAHGLITFTRLIENNDPSARARKAIVLRLFQENLKHDDSFIYLASINGLCALAAAFPKEVIEALIPEYIDMPNRAAGAEVTVETRIKLGEILVKTTRALGEMSVVHKNALVNGFLCTTRDADPLIRASSLSCLGELCKVLSFRLGNVLVEILYCITCIVKSDKAPECRRAAVLVATLLFRGLGRDTLNSLGRDLVDLYRGLKELRDNDDDPVLRLHAQIALEEIDHTVRDFIFAPSKLEKTFLLDPFM
ncbi:transport and Golgi organization protein 6 homolog isoform X2 [Linepithema humile]|uniref:transport and Golgi organization protein 6 homolog isoform X2 n=1 Tax=Linepithema humile TaxID=83485 RepID=UPI0006230557|nr:PREDICTED: transport and Golgi organization protein 6 homolog isoform X2 [Linepithema humile]